MAITVQSIVDKLADGILNDSNNDRWSVDELVDWINDAQLQIATSTSDGYLVTTANVTVDSGSRQTMPADAIRLIDITNAEDGSGALYLVVRKQKLYAAVLGTAFYNTTATDRVKEWYYDDANPLEFEVYPKGNGSGGLEIVYAAHPPTLVIGSSDIGVPAHYSTAIIDYVAYRAFSKDTEDVSADLGRASAFFQAFAVGIGMKAAEDVPGEPVKIEP